MARQVSASKDSASVHRVLFEAIERTVALGRVIEITLDDAERELEDIRRMASARKTPGAHSV
jgi:hypothetical protein